MLKQLLSLLLLAELGLAPMAFAAKKDFKGLFGSYRRERFVENENKNSDWGMDIMLSTLLPVSSVVNSTETTTPSAATPMPASTFFNFELTTFVTLNYNWELFGSLGYYNYETRRQNAQFQDNARPIFHQFQMDAIPVVFGAKYRLSTEDIVPYIGAGVGLSYVRRKGFYDYSNQANETTSTPLTFELLGGFEFFISSRAGIRLEVSIYNFQLKEFVYQEAATGLPIIVYNSSPFMVRYASGVFFLF